MTAWRVCCARSELSQRVWCDFVGVCERVSEGLRELPHATAGAVRCKHCFHCFSSALHVDGTCHNLWNVAFVLILFFIHLLVWFFDEGRCPSALVL